MEELCSVWVLMMCAAAVGPSSQVWAAAGVLPSPQMLPHCLKGGGVGQGSQVPQFLVLLLPGLLVTNWVRLSFLR